LQLERWLILTALCAPSCASTVDYVTGEPRFNRFSLAEESELGTREATLMIASAEALGLVIDLDGKPTRLARGIAARILAVPENRARMPPFSWEVHVVQDRTTNAWTFPGGQLVLMAGLFDEGFVADDDEAAALIGHEIAHAALRHATERRTVEALRSWLEPFGRFFGPRLVEVLAPGGPREAMRALSKTASDYDQSQEMKRTCSASS
jgi:predicted Zn-dependent protease